MGQTSNNRYMLIALASAGSKRLIITSNTTTTCPHLRHLSTSHSTLAKKSKMPPKKAAVVEKPSRLGRPSNNLQMGIVGMPNLGKVANFPYATIDPEEARVPVPDWRIDWLHETYKSSVKIPAFLTCTDIAGLTKGASTGAGLGNAFLSHV